MFGLIVTGVRSRRRAAHAAPQVTAADCAVTRYVNALGDVSADTRQDGADDWAMDTAEVRRPRRASRAGRRRADNEYLKNIIGPIEEMDHEGSRYNWIWRHGWRLDRKSASLLAYQLKTRAITVILVSLGLQLPGILKNQVPIIILAITAGGVNWVAEYFKHQVGPLGMSVTLGFRWRTRFVPTLWLIASPRK
jgi:hypothetical protein